MLITLLLLGLHFERVQSAAVEVEGCSGMTVLFTSKCALRNIFLFFSVMDQDLTFAQREKNKYNIFIFQNPHSSNPNLSRKQCSGTGSGSIGPVRFGSPGSILGIIFTDTDLKK